jgi:hypothetical protein
VLKGVVLLIHLYVKGLLFVLCNVAFIVFVVFVVSEGPESICMTPKGLDKGTFACFGRLCSHILSPKFGPSVVYAALEKIRSSDVRLENDRIVK